MFMLKAAVGQALLHVKWTKQNVISSSLIDKDTLYGFKIRMS